MQLLCENVCRASVNKDVRNQTILVYRKETHTDQYLNSDSHHPLQHKLSAIRTILDRCVNIVTDDEDWKSEVEYSIEALSFSGYPDRCFKMVQRKMNEGKKRKKRVVPAYQV